MSLCEALLGRAAMAAPELMEGHGELTGEGEEGEGGGGEGGAAWGAARAPWGGADMEEGSRPFICSCMLLLSLTCCCTWEGRSKEKERRKEKEEKEKKYIKKYEKFSKLQNFRGEKQKTIYEVGKNYFCTKKE
jgi:hypothetical protein